MNSKPTHSRKFFYLTFVWAFMACSDAQIKTQSSEYFSTAADSINALKVQNSLIPMYGVAGKVKRKTIAQMMQQDSIPGMSIAFVDHGEIVWTKHYGYANLEDSIPITANTVFTGASLSKPVTAIAALRLVESGVLDLDQNVNLKLKEWQVPETDLTKNQKVTLRRLIAHEAGIKNDLWSSYLPSEEVPTLNQMLSGQPPSIDPATSVVFEPGSRSKYSNPGYSIIQKLLMDVNNSEFDILMDELVFTPVGMNDSSFKQPIPETLKKRKATGYSKELAPYPYRLFPYQAAGGIWTTPTDLAKFLITLLDDHHQGTNTLVSKQTTQDIFTKESTRYVFSLWNWGDDIVFNHYGSNQGFNCFMYGSVNKQQGIVIMTNSDNAFGIFDYIQRAVNHQYDWEYVKPEIREPVNLELSWMSAFLGDYQWRGSNLTLNQEKDQVFLTIDDTKYALVQTPDRVFILEELPLKITFPTNPDDYRMTIWGPGSGPVRLSKIGK